MQVKSLSQQFIMHDVDFHPHSNFFIHTVIFQTLLSNEQVSQNAKYPEAIKNRNLQNKVTSWLNYKC